MSNELKGRIVCLLCLLTIIIETPGTGQVSPSFTQFYVNPYHFNPSYAGIEGRPTLFLYHTQQWVGIEGAPVTTSLSFHTPLKLGVSIGLDVYNDSRGLLKTNSGLITIGYVVPFSRTKFLRFGISAGAGFRNIDLSDPSINQSDPALKNINNGAVLNGNFGASFQSGYFNVGASIPNLFEPNFDSIRFSPMNELLFNIGYRFYFSGNNLAFEPQLLYRYNKMQPSQYEGAGILHIKNLVWLGGTYRQDYGISAVCGVKIKNFLSFGYSYGIGSKNLPGIGSSTHEFLLTLFTGKPKKSKKKEQRMILSFINAEKYVPPKEEKKPLVATTKVEPKKEEVKQQPVKQEVKTDPNAQQNNQALTENKPVNQEKKPVAEITPFFQETKPEIKNEEKGVTQQQVVDQQAVTNKITNKTDSQKIPAKNIKPVLKTDTLKKDIPIKHVVTQTEIRHEFAQMGTTSEDLQPGSYIIVGVFNHKENADKMIRQTDNRGLSASKGFVSAKGYWYVYVMKSDYAGELRDHLDEVRDKSNVKDAWLLTIYKKGDETSNKSEENQTVEEQQSQNNSDDNNDAMAAIGKDTGVKLEVVSKGDNMFELLKGNYIVVSVFSSFEAAERYSDQLDKIGQKIKWGYNSEKKNWYAYEFYDTTTEKIKEQLIKVRNVPQLKDSWLLTVR